MTSTLKSRLQASGHQNPTSMASTKRPSSSMAANSSVGKSLHLLSAKTKKLLKKVLLKVAKSELDIELRR